LEEESSNCAYRDEADRLIDFNFDALREVVRILSLARKSVDLILSEKPPSIDRKVRTKNEMHLERATPPVVARGNERLLSGSIAAGKSVAFDSAHLRSSREKLCMTQEQAAVWFKVTLRQYKRWEGGQSKMHRPNHRNFLNFVKSAELGLPLNRDTQMSPPPVTEKSL
jgi:DNA-binding transcriptional regulator YiaG